MMKITINKVFVRRGKEVNSFKKMSEIFLFEINTFKIL